MKTRFSILRLRVVLILLTLGAGFPLLAALQEVSLMNTGLTAPPDGNGDSWAPILSPDGRYVLFASTANNVALAGTNLIPVSIPPCANVYLRDRLNGTTTLVSIDTTGTYGSDANCLPTGLSTNGQYVLFESAATNLVANDTASINKVFLRDVVNGITSLVSVTPGGTNGNDVSRGSTMTPNGRYVAFVSAATNLIANDTNGIPDVFVRDMQEGTTTLVSVGAMGTGGTVPEDSAIVQTNSSEAPEITPDGRYVAFYSTATNLVRGVTSTGEIYVRDLVGGTTIWASTNAQSISGLNGVGGCFNEAISDNGQYVAFEIGTNNLGNSSAFYQNGYILRNNLQTGFSDIVASNAYVLPGAYQTTRSLDMTPDGQNIVYITTNEVNNSSAISLQVDLWNAQSGTNFLVSANYTNGVAAGTYAYSPEVDPSGRYVVFYCSDPNLTGSTNGGGVFLRDTQAGTTTLVSVDTNGNTLLVDAGAVPVLSSNAQYVAFESPHANLDGRNFYCDVFFRNLASNAAELVSARAPALASVTPNGSSAVWATSLNSNSRYVAFSSWANNLVTNDTNICINVFVRDMAEGQNLLVSVTTNGMAGNTMSTEPAISGNGRYVAFASVATNIVNGASGQSWQIILRDLQGGTNSLVSVSITNGPGNGDSTWPAISTDGRYILFSSTAGNLVSAMGAAGTANLYLRDVKLSQTYALTTASYSSSAMTPNGNYVAFITNNALYVWNSKTTSLIYTNTSGMITNVSISQDGAWVAYESGSGLYAGNVAAQTNCFIGSGPFNNHGSVQFSSSDRFLTYSTTAAVLPNDTNNASDVYLYDFQAGTNLLVSQSYLTQCSANGNSDSAAISPDGHFVAYRSYANNLAPGTYNSGPNLFLYDRLAQTNIILSSNLAGIAGNNRSLTPVFSADSQTVVFESWASDLGTQDFNSGSDLFAFNLFGYEIAQNETNAATTFTPQVIFQGLPGQTTNQLISIVWPFISAGATYSVQYKNNITDPTWQNLNSTVTVVGDEIYFTDPSPAASQRFYRLSQSN